jgi:hypothetical protein
MSYLGRVFSEIVHHPLLFTDRLQSRVELILGRRDARLPAHNDPSTDVTRDLHRFFEWPIPCEQCAGFEAVWTAIVSPLGTTLGHDGSRTLCESMWAIVRHLDPTAIVETGVARGVTSAMSLQALRINGSGGQLWSIDLPPVFRGWDPDSSRTAVPSELRDAWEYLPGASRRVLPRLVREVGEIQLFLHDSLHTYSNVLRELEVARSVLATGGVIVVDDAEANRAAIDFSESNGLRMLDIRTGTIGRVAVIAT